MSLASRARLDAKSYALFRYQCEAGHNRLSRWQICAPAKEQRLGRTAGDARAGWHHHRYMALSPPFRTSAPVQTAKADGERPGLTGAQCWDFSGWQVFGLR